MKTRIQCNVHKMNSYEYLYGKYRLNADKVHHAELERCPNIV